MFEQKIIKSREVSILVVDDIFKAESYQSICKWFFGASKSEKVGKFHTESEN